MTDCAAHGLSRVTLYERLGGGAGLRTLIDGIVAAHLENPKIRHRFTPYLDRPDRVEEIKRHTCAYFSEGSGGPDTYRGRSMTEAHRGMLVTDAEYTAATDDIIGTLARHGHDDETRAEVRDILEAIRGEIVGV